MELKELLRILFRKWWIVLPVFLVTLGATAYYTFNQVPVYQSRATYVTKLSSSLAEDKNFTSALDVLSRRAEIAATYAEVAKSRTVRVQAGDRLEFSPAYRQLFSVQSRTVAGTNLIEITTEGPHPELVMEFNKAVGEATVAYVNGLYEAYSLMLLDMPTNPGNPVRPKIPFQLGLGALFGLFLGLGLALLSVYLQGPPHTPDPVQGPDQPPPPPYYKQGWGPYKQDWEELWAQFEAMQRQVNQTRALLQNTHQAADELQIALKDLRIEMVGITSQPEKAKPSNKTYVA